MRSIVRVNLSASKSSSSDRGVPTPLVGRGRRIVLAEIGCRPTPSGGAVEIVLTEMGGADPPCRRGARTASSQVARSLPPSMRSTAAAHSSPLEIVLAKIGCRRRGVCRLARRRSPERMGLTLAYFGKPKLHPEKSPRRRTTSRRCSGACPVDELAATVNLPLTRPCGVIHS